MEEFKRIKRELVHKGHIIDMYEDTMEVPNGNIALWDLIDHKGAAAVVPVLEDGRILMVHQYRNALERQTTEIPAGGYEKKDKSPMQCAVRELEEETGYKSDNVEHLIDIYTTVAFCNEKISSYVARDLVPTHQHLDEDEYVDVAAYRVDELVEKIYGGQIQDSKTICAILAYQNKYCR